MKYNNFLLTYNLFYSIMVLKIKRNSLMALLYDKFEMLNDKYDSIWKFYDNEIIDNGHPNQLSDDAPSSI